MFCCLAGLACLTVVISIISNPPVKITGLAEARGFEPPVPRKRDNSLAVSPIRPLWHASLGVPILSDRRIERLHTPFATKGKTCGQRAVLWTYRRWLSNQSKIRV